MKECETNINIRLAGESDAELLSALGTTTFYEAYFEQDVSDDLGAYCVEAFNLAQIKSEIENRQSTFFIAEWQGKAVGYAKLREDSTAPGTENLNGVELQRIYILEKVKGRGVGQALMKRCFAEAARQGYASIWLGVWRYNLPAQQFYEKLGFEKVGELQFKYGDGFETNFVLAKKL
jgi:diamine N-acetyltransferase